MAETSPSLNQKQTDPNLADLFNQWAKELKLSINCHAVGTVQSFNAEEQTVEVTINYKKSYLRRDENGVYSRVLVDYPLLLDVPVVILGGGKFKITFPIAAGDECLILFNDRSIDNWFATGQITAPGSSRLHSFSDGFALVGVNSIPNAVAAFDETRAGLIHKDDAGDTMVMISATKVKIANPTTTLNTMLALLIDTINAITTTNAVVGVPCALSPASITALNLVKTQIAGLLE